MRDHSTCHVEIGGAATSPHQPHPTTTTRNLHHPPGPAMDSLSRISGLVETGQLLQAPVLALLTPPQPAISPSKPPAMPPPSAALPASWRLRPSKSFSNPAATPTSSMAFVAFCPCSTLRNPPFLTSPPSSRILPTQTCRSRNLCTPSWFSMRN